MPECGFTNDGLSKWNVKVIYVNDQKGRERRQEVHHQPSRQESDKGDFSAMNHMKTERERIFGVLNCYIGSGLCAKDLEEMLTLRDAKEASDSIVRMLKPVLFVLFGSVARDRTGADLDLLIVAEDEKKLRRDPNVLVHKCLKKFYRKFPIDPFIVPQSVLKEYYLKGSPFLGKISREGKVLYMKNAVQEWLKQSSDELNMAEYLFWGIL